MHSSFVIILAWTIKPGSMGKPIPGVEAAIVDDQGNELPPNRNGEFGY